MKKKINNKGFTLIELLAVIAITAIILGVGTYGIVDLVTKSKEKGSLISETSIKESASLYADEAGDSLWIDPGSGDYKYYCITIEELINKGIIKKNAKLPKGIDKYNYVSIKKNKVTFVKNDPVILDTNADVNSTDYRVCTGNKFEEKVSKTPEFTGNKSWTDSLEVSFNDGKAESDIKDKWCQYDTTSSISGDKNIIVLDSKTNTCNIDKNLTNKTSYYVRICMSTVRGSTMCSDTNSYSTADFVSPEFFMKDDTITIKYKDDNVKEPYHYFKSNVNGNSDKNVSECTLGSDNKFTCSGSTSNITKDKWYKVNENEVKITYKDNEIKNGDITARIMDGTGNYKDSDKKFNLYRIVFKKGNADKINNGTNDITNICLNDIDKKCSIKSPSISKDGYTIVGWNTDSTASSSIWKANTSKDIDGSNTYYPIIKSRVNIKLNANGGSVTKKTSKGGTYTTDSSGIISRNGNNIFHTINYGEKMNSDGLANYNNKDYLYITKNGSIVTKNKEWICLSGCTTSGKVYSQYEAYSSDDFCDAKDKSCTVVLGVNWKNVYTISYDANGGSNAPSNQTKIYGQSITLSSSKPIRTGYTFQGWATTSSATTATYQPGATYTANANLTLYAVWKANTYTVTYNANGGTGAPSSQTKTYGVNLTLSSTKPTRTGYTFQGWAASQSATSAQYQPGGKYTGNANLTLYAVWKAVSKPVITRINNESGGNWVNHSFNTYIYATDDEGISRIEWSTDKTNWYYSDMSTPTMQSNGSYKSYGVWSGAGNRVAYFRALNTNGLYSDLKSTDIKIDMTAPDVTIEILANGTKISECSSSYCTVKVSDKNASLSFKIKASDYSSRLKSTVNLTATNPNYSGDESYFSENASYGEHLRTLEYGGNRTFTFKVSDIAGNVNTMTISIVVPNGPVYTCNGNHSWTARGNHAISFGTSFTLSCHYNSGHGAHSNGYAIYCSKCGMSVAYYRANGGTVDSGWVCPQLPFGKPEGWKVFNDSSISNRTQLKARCGTSCGEEMFSEG